MNKLDQVVAGSIEHVHTCHLYFSPLCTYCRPGILLIILYRLRTAVLQPAFPWLSRSMFTFTTSEYV